MVEILAELELTLSQERTKAGRAADFKPLYRLLASESLPNGDQ